MNLEELEEYIKEFRLKEKGENALKNLLDELTRTDKVLDGYLIESLTYKYNRHEIRLLNENSGNSLLIKFDIYSGESKSNLPMGYYDYEVNFQGEFIDEFLAFENDMKNKKTLANKG
ncbi:MAG: hypothetical protein CVT94_19015 [Bacteroidetes bacterium HGW-Bacteroidetes-11]|jgi:hypothetical protein|nr:MAG: hypothetical protein CVT94_19015 [Bacteroidetes bacterium HGW-Bacteroidetes-11]